jgi:hypothetical protein
MNVVRAQPALRPASHAPANFRFGSIVLKKALGVTLQCWPDEMRAAVTPVGRAPEALQDFEQ